MLGMWDSEDAEYWVCGMFGMVRMWDVWNMEFLRCGCSECGMLTVWIVEEVGIYGFGILRMWDVQDGGCGM